MTQFILLIQGNATSEATGKEWDRFFDAAKESGCFRGGSEIGERQVVGDSESAKTTAHIVGFMRFDAMDRQVILDLLKQHPTVLRGGSVELCEMPKS